jgi:hypothetical protein
MSNPASDDWPPYITSSKEHLHAVGVLAYAYNGFEAALLRLYRHHVTIHNVPEKLADLYFWSLSEETRLKALKTVFEEYEKDEKIKKLLGELLNYFSWCWDVRNKLLHAVHAPGLFDERRGELPLAKRIGKKSPEMGFLYLQLAELRALADKVEQGGSIASDIQIHLLYRDTPEAKRPRWLVAFENVRSPLPDKLELPMPLTLLDRRRTPPTPAFLQKS